MSNYMGTWLGENWWWLVPMALIPVVLAARRWVGLVAMTPQGNDGTQPRVPLPPSNAADAVAKKILAGAAILLGASASHSQAVWSVLLIPCMIAVFYVPISERLVLPNWSRYLAYFSMAAVYVAVF